jgi:anti-sigma regulatory factor (Ser/Thr protein kinase)
MSVLLESGRMTPTEVRASFPSHPSSAGKARRLVDTTLHEWRCDHYLEIASLLVSELVANAVLHAGTAIHVVIRLHANRLRVEVHDGDARLPAAKHYSPLSATGRGLLLVERMAHDWGTVPTHTGKVVWFELDPQPPSDEPVLQFNLQEFDAVDLDALGSDESDARRPFPGPCPDEPESRSGDQPYLLVPVGSLAKS